MKVRKRIQWWGVILMAFAMVACQVKRPESILSDAKMEAVLYDYHVARAMGDEVPYSESYKRVLYVESVFKKHGITQADFDSSIAWFARHPEEISKIYERVSRRLKAERDYLDNLIAIRDNKPKTSQPGDSIDVWAGERIYQLTGTPLDNKLSFVLPADSNFQGRDTLRWNIRFRFDRQGMRDTAQSPVMAMQIVYENDSVVGCTRKVNQAGIEILSLFADTLGAMKEVRGFVYYPLQQVSRTLLLDRISLMRYHAADSLFTETTSDSTAAPAKDTRSHSTPVSTKKTPKEASALLNSETATPIEHPVKADKRP